MSDTLHERPRLLKQQLELQKELWRRQCRSSLLPWAVNVLRKHKQVPAAHHKLMINKLELLAHGIIDRLMVMMPPRHAKSEYCSHIFGPWFLAQDPSRAIIAASHTYDLAEKFGKRVRNTVDAHAELLGYKLATDTQAAGRWATNFGGEYVAAGVGKAIAGNPADLLIIDDPVANREQAESPTQREKTWNWYRSDAYTRLQPGGRIIVIMTRWHEDDLGGRLRELEIAGGDKWEVLKLPALATDLNDPLGRKVDEALWPEQFDYDALVRIRNTVAPSDWWSLYQQEPRPPGGSFFEIETILQDGQPIDPPLYPDGVFAIVDTAAKTGRRRDGTGVVYFAHTRGRSIPLVILDWDIQQIEGSLHGLWMPEVFKRLEYWALELKARFGSAGIWIEDQNVGTVILQHAARIPDSQVHAIDSKLANKGKDERAINAAPYWWRGEVKISAYAYNKIVTYKGRTANHFLQQVFRFKVGVEEQEDDLLDCACYGTALALGDYDGF